MVVVVDVDVDVVVVVVVVMEINSFFNKYLRQFVFEP
jgi:hypothetical protein